MHFIFRVPPPLGKRGSTILSCAATLRSSIWPWASSSSRMKTGPSSGPECWRSCANAKTSTTGDSTKYTEESRQRTEDDGTKTANRSCKVTLSGALRYCIRKINPFKESSFVNLKGQLSKFPPLSTCQTTRNTVIAPLLQDIDHRVSYLSQTGLCSLTQRRTMTQFCMIIFVILQVGATRFLIIVCETGWQQVCTLHGFIQHLACQRLCFLLHSIVGFYKGKNHIYIVFKSL